MNPLTDSKQMFDVISKASHTTERRLVIDIMAAREAYNRGELSSVDFVLAENKISDGRTEAGFCRALSDLIRTVSDRNPVEQWIVRMNTASKALFRNGGSVKPYARICAACGLHAAQDAFDGFIGCIKAVQSSIEDAWGKN